MKAPENLLVKSVAQARWVTHQQKLVLCQFYPNNPIWVARPYFPAAAARPYEPIGPHDIAKHVNNKQALEGCARWLSLVQDSPFRARAAWVQTLNPRLTPEARAKASKPISHITSLWEKLNFQNNLGLIFPEGMEIIIDQVKTIWLPEPLQQTAFLPGLWRRTDSDSHVEYVRLR